MNQNESPSESGTELEPPDILAISTETLDKLIEAGVPDAGGGYDDTGIHGVEFYAEGWPPESFTNDPTDEPAVLDLPPCLGFESWDAFIEHLEEHTDIKW